MDLFEAIKKRHCKRYFLDKAVSKQDLEAVLLAARNAASGKNAQPWQVAVITGSFLESLREELMEKAEKGEEEPPDYIYTTKPYLEAFTQRAKEVGYSLFKLKGIARDDKVKRHEHWMENYRLFGGTALMIFHLHPGAERGDFLDMGQFLQNVMLGLVAKGLGSCPQASLCAFSKTLKERLDLPQDRVVVCGLSIGYVDENAPVNTFIPKRLPLEAYTRWYE